jgi:type II secretory pathway component PulC
VDGRRFLQGKSTDRIKIYLVVGLAFVLAALVYRYLHAKASHTESDSPVSITASVADTPDVPLTGMEPLGKTQPRGLQFEESRRVFLRDIFAPARPLAGAVVQPSKNHRSSSKDVSDFKLNGIIVGGKNPIAIINGKLLRQGEKIDGYKVIRIDEKRVFLKSGRKTLKVKLVSND